VLGALAALGAAPRRARADHDMAMHDGHGAAPSLSIGLAFAAAQFENMTYIGSYQGIAPSLTWMHGRFGAGATIALYHLTENGLSRYGAGDAMMSGHVMVYGGESVQAGAALHAMVPTGSDRHGFGMGHAMAMPSLWATWRGSPVVVKASAGYGRALTSLAGSHHAHGPWPLVDPMNLEELTWAAGAELEVGRGVKAGGRTLGAVPIGDGMTRVIGAGRVAWGTSRVSTALELQVGLAGDPFTVRGVVETALRF
jgi:hypothetical protein